MASAFLDLWQDQLTRSMTDRDFVRNMMDMMQRMQHDSMDAFRSSPNAQARGQNTKNRHASAASGAGDDQLAQLAQRVADCEQRIRELEAALARANAKPKPNAKPKSKAKTVKPVKSDTRRRSGAAKPARTAKRPQAKPAAKNIKKITVKRAVKRKS
jgi:hypothetical protein